jgi:hypothetical protein
LARLVTPAIHWVTVTRRASVHPASYRATIHPDAKPTSKASQLVDTIGPSRTVAGLLELAQVSPV